MQPISPKRASIAWIALWTAAAGCASSRSVPAPAGQPQSERDLASRQLQAPLDQHLCKAAIYPTARADWRIARVKSLSGRGTNFATALEALCREADGLGLPAVVDIYFWRAPGGWSPNYELRGTAIRFEEGFAAPDAPAWDSIRPPEMPKNLDEEPPPAGEGGKKTSSRHHSRKA
jgi:hypothetical protein